MQQPSITRFAWLSIASGPGHDYLKGRSVLHYGFRRPLVSDALESVVNLVASLMALAMLIVAARPPDEVHAYGYSKAEFFSSAAEGSLIILAAGSITWAAIPRLISPQPLNQVGIGLAISVIAAFLNFLVARLLLGAGKKYRSITLEADAQHLLTDVWTSVGVVIAVTMVALTGLTRLILSSRLLLPSTLFGQVLNYCDDRCLACSTHRSLPPSRTSLNRFSTDMRLRVFAIMRYGLATRECGLLSRYTY